MLICSKVVDHTVIFIGNLTMLLALFSASFLPSVLVPLTGLVFPSIAIAAFFLYAEREDPSGV